MLQWGQPLHCGVASLRHAVIQRWHRRGAHLLQLATPVPTLTVVEAGPAAELELAEGVPMRSMSL